MESWPEQENWVQMMLAVPRAEATRQLELPAKRTQRERTLKESQLAEPRQVLAKRPEQAKLARPETAPVVWQLVPPVLAFASQAQRSSAPLRD
jgi:hypothetical protein